MSKLKLTHSDNFSNDWKHSQRLCIAAAVMTAELPIHMSDPFMYMRLVNAFKMGYENFGAYIKSASDIAKNLAEVNFKAYRERVTKRLGYTPAPLQELYR